MKQGTILIAKHDMILKKPAERSIKVKTGDKFIITSSQTNPLVPKDCALIDRYKTAIINQGHLLSYKDIEDHYDHH